MKTADLVTEYIKSTESYPKFSTTDPGMKININLSISPVQPVLLKRDGA